MSLAYISAWQPVFDSNHVLLFLPHFPDTPWPDWATTLKRRRNILDWQWTRNYTTPHHHNPTTYKDKHSPSLTLFLSSGTILVRTILRSWLAPHCLFHSVACDNVFCYDCDFLNTCFTTVKRTILVNENKLMPETH